MMASQTDYICGKCNGERVVDRRWCPQCKGWAIVNMMGSPHTGLPIKDGDRIVAEITAEWEKRRVK